MANVKADNNQKNNNNSLEIQLGLSKNYFPNGFCRSYLTERAVQIYKIHVSIMQNIINKVIKHLGL